MGEYRDGKWVPTWGDDQFGVVDSPAQMYGRNRELNAEAGKLKDALEAMQKENERLHDDAAKKAALFQAFEARIAELEAFLAAVNADDWLTANKIRYRLKRDKDDDT